MRAEFGVAAGAGRVGELPAIKGRRARHDAELVGPSARHGLRGIGDVRGQAVEILGDAAAGIAEGGGDDDFTNILGPDGKTQLDAFKKLFGDLLYQDKSGYQALTDENCGCKDDDDDNGGDGLLSRAKAHADELARQQSAEFTKAAKALAVPVLRAASQIPGPIGAAARVLGLGMGAASLAN